MAPIQRSMSCRQPELLGQLGRVLVEQVGQAVHAVDTDRPLPAQVVQPDVLQLHAIRGDAETGGQPPLEGDRDVAQAERPMAVVDERLGDDADRVREVDDPGVLARRDGRSARRGRGRRGTVRSALAKPPAPVVSWPMTPKRRGSVSSTSRAAWPPTRSWSSTKSAPSMAASRSPVRVSRPGPAQPIEHPLGEAADDLEPLRVDVEQDELVDRQAVRAPGEALDQFRRVGAARRRRP